MSFDVDRLRAGHEEFLREHSAMVLGALEDGQDLVHAGVYLNPGFKPQTGKSQAATKTRIVRIAGGRLLRVTNDSKNATRLEAGTQPHFIFPHRKPALRFRARDGRWVSTKVVRHPGTKPYWFVRNATERANDRVHSALELGMRRLGSRRY